MVARMVVLLLITYLMSPAAAHAAFAGHIALYSDVGLSECTLTDASSQIADVYVVHRIVDSDAAASERVGVMFALVPSTGFNGTWLEDIVPSGMTGLGSSPSGIAVHYVSCRLGDLLVLRVRYQMPGNSLSCSFVEAVAHPGNSSIITTTCGEGFELPVDGGRLLVNADQSCPCEGPVATQASTWGRIKAMYKN